MTDIGIEPARLLAAAAARTSGASLPGEVRERAVDILLDTLAVIALGSGRPELRELQRRFPTGTGGATVVGEEGPAPSPAAALLNGSATTVDQFDEWHRESRGHPGIHIVPAVLAVAEEEGLDGECLLAALVAGYEVAARIGKAVGPMRAGVHPHGTSAALGATVAVAHLLSGRREEAITSALESAASMTLFPYREPILRGATVHYLVVGLAAQMAVVVGYGALSGLESVPSTLERFFGPMAGPAVEAARLAEGIDAGGRVWSHYEILGNCFKLYPACGHTLPINEAIDLLRGEHSLEPETVASVEIAGYHEAVRLAESAPCRDLAARFSVPYLVAAALVAGPLSVESFSEELLSDPRIRDLARRVHLRHDPEMEPLYPREQPVAVTVRLKDGQELTHRVAVPRGDNLNPAGREELHAKAEGLLGRRFGSEAAGRIVEAALELEAGGDLAALSDALRKTAR